MSLNLQQEKEEVSLTSTFKEDNLKLKSIPTESEIEKELGLPSVITETVDPAIEAKTDQLIDDLLSDKIDETTKKRYVNEMGLKFQNTLANNSKILDQSVKTLGNTQDGGPVAKNLLDLRNEVEQLNPRHYDLSSPQGAIAKFLEMYWVEKIPLAGTLKNMSRHSM